MEDVYVPQEHEFEFGEYWRVILRRRTWGIATFLGILAGIVVVTFKQTALYEASAIVRVSTREPLATIQGERITWYAVQNPLETEVELIHQSDSIHERAARELREGNNLSPELKQAVSALTATDIRNAISVEQVRSSNLISITARGPTPAQAALVANAVARAYLEEYVLSRTVDAEQKYALLSQSLEGVTKELEEAEHAAQKAEEAAARIGTADRFRTRIAEVDVELAQKRQSLTDNHPDVQKLLAERQELEAALRAAVGEDRNYFEVASKRDRLRGLRDQLALQVHAAKIDFESKRGSVAGMVKIESLAEHGVRKVRPNELLNIGIGSLLGLICAVLMCFLVETLDTSIGRVEDIERRTGLSVMALIPFLGGSRPSGFSFRKKYPREDVDQMRSRLVFNLGQQSMAVECYRTLRESVVDAMSRAGGGNAVIVTSAAPQEGKTLTALNLALLTVQMGRRVLLIEAEMRKPGIHRFLSISRSPGLSDLLLGKASLGQCTRGIVDLLIGSAEWDPLLSLPNIGSLHVMTSGTPYPNPVELLASPAMGEVVREVSSAYDIVYLDTPPVMPVADTFAIGKHVDKAIMVYTVGGVSRHLLLRALKLLREKGINVLGIVLNQIDPDVHLPSYYRQAYSSRYGYMQALAGKR
jgi:tyrosine-protein kinase Etk/Wzc